MSKVIIVPCSGIGKTYGTVSREAAYEVVEDLRPETAGIVALSTYLPTPDLVESEGSAANAAQSIFAAHGTEDDVVYTVPESVIAGSGIFLE